LDLVEPHHGGRDRLEQVAGTREGALRLPVAAREDLDHVDAIERQLQARRDRLDAEALAAPRDAHHQDTLPPDPRADLAPPLAQLTALVQPLLHDLEAADLVDAGHAGDVLDETDAIDELPLLLEQDGN